MFRTNNDESIILVYHVGVAGMSPMYAENEMNHVLCDYMEDNPKIKQIFLADWEHKFSRVECIYPIQASKEILDKLISLESKLSEDKSSSDKDSK